MKPSIVKLIVASFLMFIVSFGCGGGGNAGGVADDATPAPSISEPGGGTDDSPEDAAGGGGTGTDEATGTIVQQKVLISGLLVGPEGVGLPNTQLTIRSDPIFIMTDPVGSFQVLLEVGEHTFEVVSDEFGNLYGTLTVTASSLVNQAGQTLGNFIATTYDPVQSDACGFVNLVDLGETQLFDTGVGVILSAAGDEISVQGKNQTSLVVGNSEMLANISIDGRLSGFTFPTVGAFNHIPYLSEVQEWVKPFQGSFGGIKRGDDYYWLTNRDYWDHPIIKYQSGTFAPIAEMTYDGKGTCEGAKVTEKVYVAFDGYGSGDNRSNVLIRDFTISFDGWGMYLEDLCKTTENASASPELALYARFNTNDTYQLFKQWIPSDNTRSCFNNRMYWQQEDEEGSGSGSGQGLNPLVKTDPAVHSYSIVMSGSDRYGNVLDMDCTPSIVNTTDAWRVAPWSACVPTGVRGSIAEWEIPVARRLVVATAGCDGGGTPCESALDSIETTTNFWVLENTVKTEWNNWVKTPAVTYAWRDRTKRWLVTMKMLADRNTDAIIAAPSQEPTFYYSWPRDGVFQSLAFMMAGKYEVVEGFFNYLFDMFDMLPDPDIESDYGWNQAYSSLADPDRPDTTPVRLGLPNWPDRINVEEDQAPTVLWGLWVYWTKNDNTLPSRITAEKIKKVADYVVAQICPVSGLIRPSIDRLESPLLHMGQSLYTNAAAYAGLAATAEMLESSDSKKADDYREIAGNIREAILDNLCDSDTCHTRISYHSFVDLMYPGLLARNFFLLGNRDAACEKCSGMPYVDEDLETMMAFAWPFHALALDDPRVKNYFDVVWSTHDNLSDFTAETPLWVPRYLYSYLYAKAAYASDDLDADYKAKLLPLITEVESNIDAVTTDYGYLMDNYIGGEEGDVYGEEYAGKKLGAASRPLGWAQAMGVLMAYAINNQFVPMLNPPAPASECTSGDCCDADGYFRPDTYTCSTTTEYGCPDGTACGQHVKRRTVTQKCSGSSSDCDGGVSYGGWIVQDYCNSSEMCVVGNPVCQPCGSCECTSGDCCDGCNFKSTGTQCDVEEDFRCEESTTCGDDVEVRTRQRTCNGASATCPSTWSGWSSWSTHENCSSDEKCNTSFECEEDDDCKCCTSGPCCNTNDTCKSSSTICDSNVQTIYECDGSSCGDDLLKKVKKRYCPGDAGTCTGSYGWTTTTYDNCNQYEKCSIIYMECRENAACCPPVNWSANLHAQDLGWIVKLYWDPAPGATGYVITRMPGSGSCPPTYWKIGETNASTTAYFDDDLGSGCAQYGVFALNDCDEPGGCGGTDVGCMPE